MSFPRYPRYKDSGVVSLGEVPENWDVTQLKRIVDPTRPITYGIVQAGPHVPDGVPYIRPADMTDERGIASLESILRTDPAIAETYSRSTIRTGDLVTSIGPSFGKVMVTPPALDGANLTQGTARIAVASAHDPRYVFWVLRSKSAMAQWESSVGGATFRALNLGPIAATTVPLPPLEVQRSIGVFLDRETLTIDALVSKQQRLVELLTEKRQAVISHAVTRGLNPHAPLKPSGVEWLGEVPAHWRVSPIKQVVDRIQQGWSPQCESDPAEDGEKGVLKVGCVNGGTFRPTENKKLPDGVGAPVDLGIRRDDLLVSRANTRELVGSAAIVLEDYPNLLLCDKLYRLRCRTDLVISAYLQRFLMSDVARSRIELGATGASASMQNISQSILLEMHIPLPEIDEQRRILTTLASELSHLETLQSNAEAAIQLLRERRTALISAAVTGKIDVRALEDLQDAA
jgi:type I restriction enzyme, S subunit